MTKPDRHAVSLGDNLSRSRDRQVGMRFPIALDEKLDRLLAACEEAGERTNRKELVAALIAVCDLNGSALGESLRKYRTMTVRDVIPDAPAGADVVRLADHRPGPRSVRR
jgi:hypothetical protein